jgi:nitrogen-specific signal transduction histidine kinase
MNDQQGDFIGVISVDNSKSGLKPTDETVQPLEIFASLISQIIVLNRSQQKQDKLELTLQHVQKLESIGLLAGGVAHDFNNILGIIVGNAELALEDLPQWSPALSSLEEIRKAGMRACRHRPAAPGIQPNP